MKETIKVYQNNIETVFGRILVLENKRNKIYVHKNKYYYLYLKFD